MTTREPTVVYRSRSLTAAKELASFLRDNGVDARSIEGNRLGHAHPAIDFFHDVMAVNFDRDGLVALIANWESLPKKDNSTMDGLFCYHCGEELDKPAPVCPHCNEPLAD